MNVSMTPFFSIETIFHFFAHYIKEWGLNLSVLSLLVLGEILLSYTSYNRADDVKVDFPDNRLVRGTGRYPKELTRGR